MLRLDKSLSIPLKYENNSQIIQVCIIWKEENVMRSPCTVKQKILSAVLMGLMLTVPAGYGNREASAVKTETRSSGVSAVLEQGMADADSKAAVTESQAKPDQSAASETPVNADQAATADIPSDTAAPEVPAPAALTDTDDPGTAQAADGIDVDLTVLSATMVYSEVYNMMVAPEEYVGKTIKMNGLFTYAQDEETGQYYFGCIVQDATACCAQGIEFELTGEHTFPDDYPEVDSEICVVGTFDTYDDGGYTYCTLRNASLL